MLASKDRHYYSIEEYFEHIADKFGFPELHHHFVSDYFVSDGLQIHVDVLVHDKNAPTIVFIPGTAIYALCYSEFLFKLHLRGFNVVGFDPRGHGRSEGARGDYTVDELMRDAHSAISYAINKFNDNVSLMGSSQGGIVSLYMAAKDSRLKGVVYQNFADLTAPDAAKLTRFPRLSKYLRPLLLNFGGVMPNTPIPIEAYLDLELVKIKHFGNMKNFVNQDPLALHHVSFRALQSLASTPLPKPLHKIEVPVMVFQGTADSIFSVEMTQNIFDQLECKKHFELFEGQDHAIIAEVPDLILPSIVNWLEGIHDYKAIHAHEIKMPHGVTFS
jgi:pimeloyl-ACP methyl ester carboxylesterase